MDLVPAGVVGMKAGGREHIAAYVRIGDVALLMPEPTNPHDPNAVAVHVAPRSAMRSAAREGTDGDRLDPVDRSLLMDRQVGYLPRGLAARIAPTLGNGGLVTTVTNIRWHPDDTIGRTRAAAGLDVNVPRPPRGAP